MAQGQRHPGHCGHCGWPLEEGEKRQGQHHCNTCIATAAQRQANQAAFRLYQEQIGADSSRSDKINLASSSA
jgi:hypothetical protein